GADGVGGGGEVGGGGLDVREHRDQRVERVRGEAHPLQGAVALGQVRADLQESERVVAVDADGAGRAALRLGAAGGVRVVDGALVVGAEYVLDVLDREQTLRSPVPGEGVGVRARAGVPAVPVLAGGVQGALHVPGAGRVVEVVVLRVG